MTARTTYFSLFLALSLLWFRQNVTALLDLAWTDDRYTHIVFVPLLSLGLIYLKRTRVLADPKYNFWMAAPLAALFATPLLWGGSDPAVAAAAVVLSWIAGFILFFGVRCAKAALFPLAVLLLAIPIPSPAVVLAEVALQRGSAEMTHVIFQLLGIPVFREGLVFALPGVTIEVARECSGIRSSISLLITALVLSHLFLRSNWSRVCCVILILPIAILKNAMRIATLSSLGSYVSQDYLNGPLHHSGGPVFSLLSLAMLLSVLWLLRRYEGVPTTPLNHGPTVANL